MSSSKSELTCNICKLLVNKPVTLPCSDVICDEHLSDDSAKNGLIKCMKCDKDFNVPRRGFPSNKRVTNLLAKERHLSNEEKSIKHAIQELIQKLEQLQYDVRLKENNMELTSFDHFTEIRRQIDIQREELKNKIDEIALRMIDQANEREKAYQLKLKESISVIIDTDIKQFSQLLMREFRDPDLLVDKVKLLQIKHEQNVKDFQTRISDFDSLGNEIKLLEFVPKQEFQEYEFGGLKLKGSLVACTLDKEIEIWNIASNEWVASLFGHSWSTDRLENIDENRFASVSIHGEIRIWNAKSFACLKKIQTLLTSDDDLCLLSLSSNRIAISFKRKILIVNINSGEFMQILNGHIGRIPGLICLPNGNLVSCSIDGTIKVWNLNTGALLKTIESVSDRFRCIILLKNGHLASGSDDDNDIKIWNMRNKRCVKVLQGHKDSVWRLQVLESGELISCSTDKTIKIWNTHEGKCILTLKGHTNHVESIRIHSQTNTLVSRDSMGIVKKWNLKTGECLNTINVISPNGLKDIIFI